MNTSEKIEEIISLSEIAIEEVHRMIDADSRENIGLRLGVKGGGCSGLSYVIDLDESKDKDIVQSDKDFDIFIDPKSSLYLKGMVLDFNRGLQDHGFKFKNPNADNTCGCGMSFSV